MRKVILKAEDSEYIVIDQMSVYDIVAYKSKNGTTYCILKKIVKGTRDNQWVDTWGFVPIGTGDDTPRYISNTWRASMELAGKARELKQFANPAELISAMYHKKF